MYTVSFSAEYDVEEAESEEDAIKKASAWMRDDFNRTYPSLTVPFIFTIEVEEYPEEEE